MTRREILVEMLRRYDEARTLNGRDGLAGDGGGVTTMPATWNSSYRELENCLIRLRASKPILYRHVGARLIDRREAVRTLPVVAGEVIHPRFMEVAAGQSGSGDRQAVFKVYTWPEWVDEKLVSEGVDWLSDHFRGDPYLPREFYEAA